MAMVRMPSSVEARNTRTAISPRLAQRSRRKGVMAMSPAEVSLYWESAEPEVTAAPAGRRGAARPIWRMFAPREAARIPDHAVGRMALGSPPGRAGDRAAPGLGAGGPYRAG